MVDRAAVEELNVKPSRESNVIQVGYRSPDPRFAAGLANAFANAYIATTLELKVDPAKQFSSFFTAQSKDARLALETAPGQVVGLPARQGHHRRRRAPGRGERPPGRVEQPAGADAGHQQRKWQPPAAGPGTQGDRMQEVLNNPVIGSLKADLSRGEARLQELNSKFGDNHPQVVEAKANIASCAPASTPKPAR